MAIPQRINPTSLDDYLEIITRAVFQAGVRWSQIEKHWSDYQSAFAGFDVHKVAAFTSGDVERLMEHEGIMHSKKKIEGTIKNAQMLIELDTTHRGIRNYLRSKGSYEELSKDIKKRFSFVGELSVYYFLFRVGEQVPDFEQWSKSIEGDHPRMREMVQAANLKATS